MKNNDLPWPKKGEKLFKETGSYYQHSHFAWGNWQTQFVGYTDGYKNSADELIELAISSQDIQKLDTFVYPICFLYRQYLELEMKGLYLKYSEDSADKKSKTIKDVNHSLLKIWNKIKLLLTENANETEFQSVDIVEEYITEFHNYDNSSFSFRYPIDKKLNLLFGSEKRLDLSNLKDRMNELQHFFDGCDGALSEIKSIKHEMSTYFSE